MNNKLKIAFFGTSDRSLPILNILKKNYDLAICFTKKDSLVGRDQVKRSSAVKTWALENNIPSYEIENIRLQSDEIVSQIKNNHITMGIVADFKFIIPIKILSSLDLGLINIHFSILPKYRGASPIQHAILNGDEITGVTYLLTTAEMDGGDIIFQFEQKIDPEHTSDELYKVLFVRAADKLPEVINNYVNKTYLPKVQNEKDATYCFSKTNPKSTQIDKNDAFISEFKDASLVDRFVRAYYSWPIAWTYIKNLENATCFENIIKVKNVKDYNKRLKIYSGKLIKNNSSCNYQPEIVQVEGKEKMIWKDFLNGYCEK